MSNRALNLAIAKAAGQRALLDAKVSEFEGLRLIGNKPAADKCREDAHALLDAMFDGKGEFAEQVRLGRFS